MVTHKDIWEGIDALAMRNGLSASGLARRAGLDATTFNLSKRHSRGGRQRWPSTESIAKILDATGWTIEEFVGLVGQDASVARTRHIPILGFAQAGKHGFFDDSGFPVGSGWDQAEFPAVGDPDAYALKVTGESMRPVYRAGDIVILSPAANIRRGDRVVVKTTSGEVMAKQVESRSREGVDLHSFNPEFPDVHLAADEVVWFARIVWASQ